MDSTRYGLEAQANSQEEPLRRHPANRVAERSPAFAGDEIQLPDGRLVVVANGTTQLWYVDWEYASV